MKVETKRQINRLLRLLSNVKRIPGFDPLAHPLLLKIRARLLRYYRQSFLDDVLGHKMYLDENDSLQLSYYGIFEPLETRFLQQNLREGNIILDIGANIGYYTLICAKHVGPSGHVFAFEPDPNNFALLSKNVAINSYQNVTLVDKAVSNISGSAKLFLSPDNKGDHQLYDMDEGRPFIDVQTIRIDDYFSNALQLVDYVKIDVQGFEYYVVQGMAELLRRSPQVVLLTEFWPFALEKSGAGAQQYLDLLQALNFKLYDMNAKAQTIMPTQAPILLETYTKNSEAFTNLLCRRET
jgi:FkbM family methyltransferase